MIGLVDYEAGNIASVSNALSALGVNYIVSGESGTLSRCSGIILPGVGAAQGAMTSLKSSVLQDFLTTATVPLLGICLGMQLLYDKSEEGPTDCLGIFKGTVRKFSERATKVPHMGWNLVQQLKKTTLLEGIAQQEYFYFAHSFFAPTGDLSVAITEEGERFTSVVQKGRYFGVQFHPEKSGEAGRKVLRNFTDLCK